MANVLELDQSSEAGRESNRMAEETEQMIGMEEDHEDLASQIKDLKREVRMLEEVLANAPRSKGNPGVVGLCGFGMATILLQFHNVTWMESITPVVCIGFFCGGFAQLVAGLQEFETGNNFGYCAFTTYGSFWMSLSLLLVFRKFEIVDEVDEKAVGFYMLAFTIFTAIMTVAAVATSIALFTTFVLLLTGFVLLDISHLAHVPALNQVAGWVLMACALMAWYCMAHLIYKDMFKRDVLPLGRSPASYLEKTTGRVHEKLSKIHFKKTQHSPD